MNLMSEQYAVAKRKLKQNWANDANAPLCRVSVKRKPMQLEVSLYGTAVCRCATAFQETAQEATKLPRMSSGCNLSAPNRRCLCDVLKQKQSVDCKTASLRKMDETDETVSGECICMLGLILFFLMISSQSRSPEKLQDVAKFPKG